MDARAAAVLKIVSQLVVSRQLLVRATQMCTRTSASAQTLSPHAVTAAVLRPAAVLLQMHVAMAVPVATHAATHVIQTAVLQLMHVAPHVILTAVLQQTPVAPHVIQTAVHQQMPVALHVIQTAVLQRMPVALHVTQTAVHRLMPVALHVIQTAVHQQDAERVVETVAIAAAKHAAVQQIAAKLPN